MHEVDFRMVGLASKSGDAIAVRWTRAATGEQMVMVVDGGFTAAGDDLVEFIRTTYDTDYVDLVVSTHRDADHINGLSRVLEELNVGLLLLHQPRNHGYTDPDVNAASDDLAAIAGQRGIPVVEPFAGHQFFEGAVTVLGPDLEWYRQCVADEQVETKTAALYAGSGIVASAKALLRRALDALPAEITFDDEGGTTARNNSSVILLLDLEGEAVLLTGDAGVPALERALDYRDAVGLDRALSLVQAPHHGSRHNVSSALLDRLLGPEGGGSCFVSASDLAPKHPAKRVANAFRRRGYLVYTTEQSQLAHLVGTPTRSGWGPATPLPPLDESDEG